MPEQPPSETALAAARADRVAFFALNRAGFERAARAAGGPVDHFFRVGGFVVRLRFAGTALAPHLTPALAHLAAEPVEVPDLTVLAWDSASTGTPPPLLLASLIELVRKLHYEYLNPRREIVAYNDERIQAAYHLGPNILSVLDAQSDVGCYWVESPSHVPYWETGAPFGALLSRWLAGRGRHYVHAAGVGTPDGGVLLAGKGGSGKSTTALACVGSDLGIIGDDYCLLADGPQPHAHSLYSITKLVGEDDLARFPRLAPWVSNRERAPDDKLLIPLHACAPGQLLPGFPVRAVLLPRVTGGPQTRARPVSAAAGLRALAPSSLLQFAAPDSLAAMARLVKRVPSYVLELGTDFGAIPTTISRLLRELPPAKGGYP